MTAKKKSKPHPIPPRFREKLKLLVRRSPPFKIVQGPGFLYFAVQSAQEEVVHRELIKTPKLTCYSVSNSKQTVIGYFVTLAGKPKMTLSEFGAAIFYTTANQHKQCKVLYSDQKLRALMFDAADYFVSVKWRSNAQEE